MQSGLPNCKSGVQGGTPPASKENCVDRFASCIFCVFILKLFGIYPFMQSSAAAAAAAAAEAQRVVPSGPH